MAKITNQSQISFTCEYPDYSSKQFTVQSNESQTENLSESFSKSRRVGKNFGVPNDEIVITMMLNNKSEFDLDNVTITETLGDGLTFKQGSVLVNDEAKPNFDVTKGYTLDYGILSQEIVIIKYSVIVDDNLTQTSAQISSQISYSVNEVDKLSENLQNISITLVDNKLTITKTADKTVVKSGDIITYQNVIENTGNCKNTEITFVDVLPQETSFVAGSVMIDGVNKQSYDPTLGFEISDLDVSNSTTIKFSVKVE